MACLNQTAPSIFILAGFPYQQELKIPLVSFFSIMFLLTLSGNSLIILMVITDLQLHKPMYWFLCHLSILDMAFSAVVVPKIIAGFNPGGKVISFLGCVTQVFFFHFLGCSESLLYTLMAYDRFLAICKPLHYGNIMRWRTCLIFSLGTIIGGSLQSTFQTFLTFHLPYGQKNYIDYVFCDIPAMLKLTCVDITLNELMMFTDVGLVAMTCFLLILASYVYIIMAILRISSHEGRHRAFSTCTAHLTVVIIYYLPVVYHYLRPASQDSMDGVVSMFYTTVTPLLNPLIYTLRNKEMKTALLKLWGRDPE
ncbi:olfactory receptor 10G6-like [Protobothrops mucrosquamatus]|uniref:olfactory receptor 10G6-like n=1 Tax=Protobothrops mucrosquamatus TaxID=103944 RepID=UPI0010FBADF3|nr:olfactory receptor 10G6-like [Protobothrops mucrosquamatus]